MFLYNGGNSSVRHVAAPVGRLTTLFGRDRQVAAPERSPPSPTAPYLGIRLNINQTPKAYPCVMCQDTRKLVKGSDL